MPSSNPLTLVVLAAGMGSRYGGLKQLDPVGPSDEVILDYSVYDALQTGFTKVVFVIRPDFDEQFRETLGRRFEGKIEVGYAYQTLDLVPASFEIPSSRSKPWGTGHAVLASKEVVDTPFVVINADDFYGRASFQSIADHLQGTSDASDGLERYSMVGFPLKNTLSEHGAVARGLCQCDEEDHLASVVEITNIRKTDHGAAYEDASGDTQSLTGNERVSMNMWGFTPSFFPYLERLFSTFLISSGHTEKSEFYIPVAVDSLIKEGKAQAKVLPTDAEWFGVTYREDKEHVVRSIQGLVDQGDYPTPLW